MPSGLHDWYLERRDDIDYCTERQAWRLGGLLSKLQRRTIIDHEPLEHSWCFLIAFWVPKSIPTYSVREHKSSILHNFGTMPRYNWATWSQHNHQSTNQNQVSCRSMQISSALRWRTKSAPSVHDKVVAIIARLSLSVVEEKTFYNYTLNVSRGQHSFAMILWISPRTY